VRVPEFIDERVSATYPDQQSDRPVIMEGLGWPGAEATRSFGKGFASLGPDRQGEICEPDESKPEFQSAHRFFLKFRQVAMGVCYSTESGWEAIGYVGNLPSATFDGPPSDVLKRPGIEQTVT
jgi:hypothetical protein